MPAAKHYEYRDLLRLSWHKILALGRGAKQRGAISEDDFHEVWDYDTRAGKRRKLISLIYKGQRTKSRRPPVNYDGAEETIATVVATAGGYDPGDVLTSILGKLRPIVKAEVARQLCEIRSEHRKELSYARRRFATMLQEHGKTYRGKLLGEKAIRAKHNRVLFDRIAALIDLQFVKLCKHLGVKPPSRRRLKTGIAGRPIGK